MFLVQIKHSWHPEYHKKPLEIRQTFASNKAANRYIWDFIKEHYISGFQFYKGGFHKERNTWGFGLHDNCWTLVKKTAMEAV